MYVSVCMLECEGVCVWGGVRVFVWWQGEAPFEVDQWGRLERGNVFTELAAYHSLQC